MSHFFHPEAEVEFLEAIDYYERREEGLGIDFVVEVQSAIDRAVQNPRVWTVLEDDVRRCQTKRFPYGVLYSEDPDGVFGLAVMHLHRAPDYWKHRR
ncbi:MAG: type II toxin-antitoxin system RelE/ParE family toxin [Kiritimatiellaeota bacterium]|nr:type II toxin-antitoxin system RelE/ParE family toxin [Kiritimatiellota bacterium]